MWYNTRHENTHFYPSADRAGTAASPSGIAGEGCLCLAPLPHLARQRPERTGHQHCPATGLRRGIRFAMSSMVSIPAVWPCCTKALRAPIVCTPAFRRKGSSGSRTRLASPSQRLWQRAQHLDSGTGRPGEFRAGDRCDPHLRRERTASPQTAQNQLERGQTVDYEPRPAVPAKKTHAIG